MENEFIENTTIDNTIANETVTDNSVTDELAQDTLASTFAYYDSYYEQMLDKTDNIISHQETIINNQYEEIEQQEQMLTISSGIIFIFAIVLIYYLYHGFKEKGIHAIWHGFSVSGIIMLFVELLEMITRPLSLAVRLFANILAGEILVMVMISMFAIALPIPFMLFEIFVAFLQAFVFMMLSVAYISTAVSEEH